MENRVYGLLIGGAVAEALGAIAELIPGIPVHGPADSALVHVAPGCWQEATTTTLALGGALLSPGTDSRAAFRAALVEPAGLTSEGVLSNLDPGTEALLQETPGTPGAPGAHTDPDTGALIRSAAVALVYFHDYPEMLRQSYATCRYTHQSPMCADTSKLYVALLDGILHGHSKRDVLDPATYANLRLVPEVQAIFQRYTSPINHLSGSHEAVEALTLALHCFALTNGYHAGLTLAVNHSLKPSHVAALYGQIAGAYYGLTDIEADWIESLKNPEPIVAFAETIISRIKILPSKNSLL